MEAKAIRDVCILHVAEQPEPKERALLQQGQGGWPGKRVTASD